VLALSFLLLAVVSAAADAQAPQPTLSGPAQRSVAAVSLADGERVELDGRLEEAAWRRATPASDFIQVDPDNGRPATEPTEVRILYTREALYLGVTCFDSEPDKWLGYQRRRDEFLSSDDRFMWTIDTFLDGRSGYFFEMNPSGLMGDSLMGGGVDNRQWDGIWNAHVVRSSIGWTIEIEIPFRTLNFDPDSDAWGINFQRTVRRRNEDSIWMGWARNQGLRRMTNAGLVTGLKELSQGLGLDVKPFLTVQAQSSPGRGTTDTIRDQKVGVDAFYSLTPSLRSVLSVNTDFAQTEVDQRQVNLTRFSLFFPEKRDFFLDGAPFFAFGSPLNGDLIVNPFFSRRVGLSPTGSPQPIDFGTKLTGQAGAYDVGVLQVQTREDSILPGDEFLVGRVRRRMLVQSYVGAIYTLRDTRLDDITARHTSGVDFRLATSRFRRSQNLEATGYYLYASGANPGNKSSFGGRLAYPNDRWNAEFSTREVGDRFDPAVGFVTRRGYRRYQPFLEFAPRPRASRIVRQYSFSASGDLQTDLVNDTLTRAADLKFFQVDFQSQESFSATLTPTYERLDAPFNIAPGIVLPAGATYDFTRFNLRGQTANRRKLAVNGSIETGGFYSGSRRELVLNVTVRARPGVIVYTTGEWNSIQLPEGRFTTRLYRLVGETQFSPWIALVNNVQYDSVSDVIGWQSRFRWIVRPGSDIYFVYTHNWLDSPQLNRFETLDRRLASKVFYTHRF
jgi:Domain of unknown function (DUF5916)